MLNAQHQRRMVRAAVNDHGYSRDAHQRGYRFLSSFFPDSLSWNYLAAIPCDPSGSPPSVSIMVRVPSLFTLKATTD